VSKLASLRLEVNNLCGDREKAKGELAHLRRQVEDAQTSEMLAVERASKTNETCNNLHIALDAEKQSSTTLREQVSLVNKRMVALEGLALVMAQTYKAVVEKFGGNTSDLPEETSTYNVLAWLKSHVEKVPSVVGGVVDLVALASATLFAKEITRGAVSIPPRFRMKPWTMLPLLVRPPARRGNISVCSWVHSRPSLVEQQPNN
jgi:hypothetical protein